MRCARRRARRGRAAARIAAGLFAFGFDAFRLAQALRHRGVADNVNVDGLTGRLSLDADRRVHREIGWAQVHGNELRLLPAAAQ